jgi:PKD repeat protein
LGLSPNAGSSYQGLHPWLFQFAPLAQAGVGLGKLAAPALAQAGAGLGKLAALALALLLPALAQAGEITTAQGVRLRPSFPNYALTPIPAEPIARESDHGRDARGTESEHGRDARATGSVHGRDARGTNSLDRDSPTGPVDTEIPFSWDQTVVLHEGASMAYILGGFDPGFQPVQFNLLPTAPVDINITSFEGNYGVLQATARAGTGGLIETFPFQVTARGIMNDTAFNLIFDIRLLHTRVRGVPRLGRTPGDFIRPGQMVRYVWTQTGRSEKRPKVEAVFVGRTGPAKGLSLSVITEVLALKVQPMVLGHYLMTVVPRDVRGEPPRGSTSNGQVFRCAFGSEDLPPVTDGFAADTFTPATGQAVTMQPAAVDPQTGRTVFDNQIYDFGDGSATSNANGEVAHAYSLPGIYRVSCTVMGDSGLTATAEDNVIVGAQAVPKLPVKYLKYITPDEAGTGAVGQDKVTVTFPGASAGSGDRIVFCFNRNRFGRLNASEGDDADIVLSPGGGFSGSTKLAKNVTVKGGGKKLSITVSGAELDRTGDPRLGRADPKGIFKNQRIAVCVVPANGSTPRVLLYTGNVTLKVKAGRFLQGNVVSEDSVSGASTTKEPDPRKQELPGF